MIDDRLRSEILSWLRSNARGAANAKPRHKLLAHILQYPNPLPKSDPDRALRRVCAEMPEVGSSLKGYFYIVTDDDRRVAQKMLHGRAMAELVREKAIRESAPCGQMGLFGGER